MTLEFSADGILSGLKDFQLASVEHAFRRLYLDSDSTRRFLIADETGLGKTMVAKGVIAKTIEQLQHDVSIRRIDIVYVCSNGDIADQNLRKLTISSNQKATPATRLTMLITQRRLLDTQSGDGLKPVTFVSFTPATSFDLGWQTGKAEERAVLYLLITQFMDFDRTGKTALKRIFKGTVQKLSSFDRYIENVEDKTAEGWEPEIEREFRRSFLRSSLPGEIASLVEEVRGRAGLTKDQDAEARRLTVNLRRLLAKSSVGALEPDLVILDEFQRFKGLLSPGSEASELAHHLFDQEDARVLLLSATPYKPFTLAEEAAAGEDHYSDLLDTLRFLARSDEPVESIKKSLAAFRELVLTGNEVQDCRDQLENSLRKLLSRIERPAQRVDRTRTSAPKVEPADIAGYVALHQISEKVEAPLTVEYWKSAPYFANFLDGYKVGEKVKAGLADPIQRDELVKLLRRTQRLRRDRVHQFQKVDWGNARLRELASETIEQEWWKLLWVPPSLPYYQAGGPYALPSVQGMTKRLVFSSWVAAPSAIASLLSYESERQIRKSAGNRFSRKDFKPRLSLRLDEGKPASMTTLGLFWPMPALASLTDPLDAAKDLGPAASITSIGEWAEARVSSLLGTSGRGTTSQSSAWYWAGPISRGMGAVSKQLTASDSSSLRDVLVGVADDESEVQRDGQRALASHLQEALEAVGGRVPDIELPVDYLESVALLGVAGPANVAWRALRRILPADHQVTDVGLWRAAALIASGFRTLFNRQEVTYLLDGLRPAEDDAYWKTVLAYCRDGNLQAVVDEYLHHLVGSEGIDPIDDQELLKLANAMHRSLTLRGATYRASDPSNPDGEGIKFFSRFAIRYGGIKQEQEDVRLPEVRAAFNSPFWPFVLATTSIGQEGVDFHWWCHGIVHWNLPSNPVDFEQREGRVNRFKGHAIRRNVATAFGEEVLARGSTDPWSALFEEAESDRAPGESDMLPYWHFPGPAVIERSILGFPLSRDEPNWQRLKDVLALYRLAYGQPRQEDMVDLLRRRGVEANDVDSLRLRLAPPGWTH